MSARRNRSSQSQGSKISSDNPVSQPTPVFTRSFTFQHASSSPTSSSSSSLLLLPASVTTPTLRDVVHFTATDVRQKNFLSFLEMSVSHVNPYSFIGDHTTSKITVKQMFDKTSLFCHRCCCCCCCCCYCYCCCRCCKKSTTDVEINCETEFEKNKIDAEACVMSTFDGLQLRFKWLRNL